jgi:short-subunit dehydrogenase
MARDGRDVVAITGASAGVGRATAHAFAERGAAVGLIARGRERLESAKREVEIVGGTGHVAAADVSDPDQVERAATEIEAALGPIDIWVNCAMVTVFSPVDELQPEEVRRVTEVTYLGTVYGTLAALARMRRRGRGTIVQVGSALAYRSIPLQSAYCGAKSAIRGFTDSLRTELIHDGSDIHVTMVQLSAFNTPQFQWARCRILREPQPVPPIFQPEFAAEGILHAAYSREREVWVGTPAFKAIIGQRVWPGLLDRIVARQAWSGQMSGRPLAPDHPDNLMEPPPGDFGTHGRFDREARFPAWQLWISTHPREAALAAGALAMLAVAALTRRPSPREAVAYAERLAPARMRERGLTEG